MTRHTSFTIVSLLALTLASCTGGSGGGGGAGGTAPGVTGAASMTISAPGITLEVTGAPYGFTVRDASGAAVLATDTRGAVGSAAGSVAIERGVSPGYFHVRSALGPWSGPWTVAAASSSARSLTVTLVATGSASVEVTHTLTDSALRVEAHLSDPRAAAPRAWSALFASPASEAFLGFGERYNRSNQRGVDVFAWSEESGLGSHEGTPPGPTNPFPSGEAMTHYPVPFFISTRGYAFWLDSTFYNEFNLATSLPDAWRVWHTGPRLAFEVYVPTPGDPRPWPYHVIDRFTARTGRPMVPPAWALGPRRRINDGAQVNGTLEIQAMRDLGLAITCYDDTCHFLPGAGQRGHEAFITSAIADARRLGYRVTGYYNPFFDDDPAAAIHPEVVTGLSSGFFLKDPLGAPSLTWTYTGGNIIDTLSLDFTSPQAAAWYGSLFSWAMPLGFSGFMCDFGEYVQQSDVGASGMTGDELHNLYPVLYQRAIHDGLEATPIRGDWLVYVRSGYTGASQWTPMVWAGDNSASFEPANGLPAMVRAGLSIGVSGAPFWGSDIGGYECASDGAAAANGELLTRWIELGALSPDMHDEDSCVAGGSGQKASIWSSPDAREAWWRYARLHTRLFPYLFTLAQEAHATGAPLMRQLFLEHPDRPDLATVDDAYYLGPALLVAPVVARGERTKTVPLPAGLYLDWQDPTVLTGNATALLTADLSKIPLLLRDGYVVPLLDPRVDTLVEPQDPSVTGPSAVADVYDVVGFISAGKDARFTLYDGGTLSASFAGGFAPGSLAPAAQPADLATGTGIYWRDAISPGLSRVRVSVADGTTVRAGGLTLASRTGRRVRWDLYLKD